MALNGAFYTILFLFTFLKIKKKNLKSFREHLSFVRQCDQIQRTWWFSPAKQGSSCIQGNQSSLLGPEDKTRGAPLSVLGGSHLPSFPVSWHFLVPVMPPDSSGNTPVSLAYLLSAASPPTSSMTPQRWWLQSSANFFRSVRVSAALQACTGRTAGTAAFFCAAHWEMSMIFI